jgi:hypothetical protein
MPIAILTANALKLVTIVTICHYIIKLKTINALMTRVGFEPTLHPGTYYKNMTPRA